MRTLHFVVPDSIDDPAHPSGGNHYDRKLIQALAASGWQVDEHAVAGHRPRPHESAGRALAEALTEIPDDSVVLIDGLLASTAATVVVPATSRLRIVVLAHLPLGHLPPGHEVPGAHESEHAVLGAATATIVTSEWTRGLLLRMYDDLDPRRVHVAEPGVDATTETAGTAGAGELLCVAAVTRHKGHDLLITALSTLTDLAWHCTCVGGLDREPEFVADLRQDVETHRLSDRITFAGPVVGADLDRRYTAADLLVLPSRGETYGMVVTEALARGVPVIAAAVGGVPDTLGCLDDGRRPGVLVPPDDAPALAAAIRRWLSDEALRRYLREAARIRRSTLRTWAATGQRVAEVIAEVA